MAVSHARVHERRAFCFIPLLCGFARDNQRPPSPTGDSPEKAPNVKPSQPPTQNPPRPTPAAETSVLILTQTVTPPPLPSPTTPSPPPPTSPLPPSPPSPPSPNESQVALAGGPASPSLLSAAAASIVTGATTTPISVEGTPTPTSMNITNDPESGPTSTLVASSTLIPLTSSSAAATSSIVPTQNASQNSHSPVIPAIVGSVAGAVVICMMIVLACLWRRRRNKKRNENNWKWFDSWKRQHRGVSVIMDIDIENQAKISDTENEENEEGNDTLSLNSSRVEQRRIRVVSMGYVTNQTGTTSNTNFVVAKPPTSNDIKPGSFTYEPHVEGSNDHSKGSRVTSSEILTDAGRRNVELLYKAKPT
ncbi:hypothetical protein ONZ45_g5469 [Pleurotus djamor]|nr:hypothetical protein ONZ45_g5469 [Pleurotus djamor]